MLICSSWPETADPAALGFQRTLLRHAQVARGENWIKKHLILVLGFCQQGVSPTEHNGDTEVRPVSQVLESFKGSHSRAEWPEVCLALVGWACSRQVLPTGLQPAGE